MNRGMRINRRQVLCASAAFGGLALSDPRIALAEPLMPLRVGEGTVPDFADIYVADKLDLWSHNGLSGTSTMFPAGQIALNALIAGKLDIASCSETPLMFAAVNGLPVRVIATIVTYQSYDLIAGPNIPSLGAMRGKKIAYLQGTNTHYYLYILLKSRGLGWGDIVAINMQPGDYVPSLVSGVIDGFVWSEPLISVALSKGSQFHRLHSEGLYYTYCCVNAMQTMIDNNPDLLVRVLKSLTSAYRVMKGDPDRAQKALSDTLKLDPSALAKSWKNMDFRVALDRSQLIPVLARQAQWGAASGLIRSGTKLPDFETVVVDEIYRRALSV